MHIDADISHTKTSIMIRFDILSLRAILLKIEIGRKDTKII
jgi:hypothetical protein